MLVVLCLIAVTILGKFVPAKFLFRYYIMAYILLATVSILQAKKKGLIIFKKFGRLRSFGSPMRFAAYVAALQVVLAISFGFIVGFGKSPYSFTVPALVTNLLFVFSSVVGIELSRSYILRSTERKIKSREALILTISSLYFAVAIYPAMQSLSPSPLSVLKFFGQRVIPLFSQQLFATLLAYIGGAYASITYFTILRAFEWFSPLLPDLDWTLNGFVATMAPVAGYFLLERELERGKRVKIAKESVSSWAATAAASILLIAFFSGAFGYHPAIVGSGSMQPAIDVGDIVVVQHVSPEELKVGDIVQYYSTEGYTITHRIIEIRETEEGEVFITKGDANEIADAPFTADRVVGKVIFVIPKLGYIPLVMRKLIRYYAGM